MANAFRSAGTYASTVTQPTQLFSNRGQIGLYHISKVIYWVVHFRAYRGRRRNTNKPYLVPSLNPGLFIRGVKVLVCRGSYHEGWRVGREYHGGEPTREPGSSESSRVVKWHSVDYLCGQHTFAHWWGKALSSASVAEPLGTENLVSRFVRKV